MRHFKSIFLSFVCLFCAVAGVFALFGFFSAPEAARASFGSCEIRALDTQAIQFVSCASGVTSDLKAPIVKITPQHSYLNDFTAGYVEPSAIGAVYGCSWVGMTGPTNMTQADLQCPGGSFVAGMFWQASQYGYNNRRLMCCSSPVPVLSSVTWEVPYGFGESGGITADCSFDGATPKPGGVIVGLKNRDSQGSLQSQTNVGIAVCQQFGKKPADLKASLSCGDLAGGAVACQAVVKNYGCDIDSPVLFNQYGLGAVFFADLADSALPAGIDLSDALDVNGWRGARKCQSDVLTTANTAGQTANCTATYLSKEEHKITFCARAGTTANPGGGETEEQLKDNCSTVLVKANLPDLKISQTECEGCVDLDNKYFVGHGDSFTLTAEIKNQGTASSAEISQENRGVTFSAGDSQQADCSFGLPALSPGQKTSKSQNQTAFECGFIFPQDKKFVDYKACADPLGGLGGSAQSPSYGDVVESGGAGFSKDKNEDNCQIVMVSVEMADLVVHSLDVPEIVPVGATQNLMFKVENAGALPSSPTQVKLTTLAQPGQGSDWQDICSKSVPSLSPAGSSGIVWAGFECPFTFSAQGNYVFKIDISPIEETNPDNNIWTVSSRADWPDLVVSEFNCYTGSPENPGTAGGVITNGEFFCRAQIKNTGAAPILKNLENGILFYSKSNGAINPIAHCQSPLLAENTAPGGLGQTATCVFSSSPNSPALFMEGIKVCADPAASGGTGQVNENGRDGDQSNCREAILNIQLPDLALESFACAGSCRAGADGKFLVESGKDFKLSSTAGNHSQIPVIQNFDVVYFIDLGNGYQQIPNQNCRVNVSGLAAGGSWQALNSCDFALDLNNPSHIGLKKIKICADPKEGTGFGKVFETDDIANNCMEKTITIGLPNFKATLNCPATVSRATPFSCTAAINNTTDIASPAIPAPQGIVFYLDGNEVDGKTTGTNNCRFSLNALPASGSQSQDCSLTFSDNLPHTIKVCADPKDKQPPYGAQFEEDDSNESNCAVATALAVVPDFVIEPYTFTCPNPIVKGQEFTCSVRVKNANAGANYATPVPIAFFVDGAEKNRVYHTFTGAAAKVTSGAMRLEAIPASGPVNIIVRLDPDNSVYESNIRGNEDAENNNSLKLENIPVAEVLLPDFSVLENSIKCYDQDLLVKTGTPFACEAKIKNVGYLKPASNFYTVFYSGWGENSFLGAEFVDIQFSPLKPGQYQTVVSVNLTLAKAGEYSVVVCADRSVNPSTNLNIAPQNAVGVIGELNETNNCLEGPAIRAVDQLLADLSINQMDVSCNASGVGIGQSFSCTATVRNIGHVNSPALAADSNGVKGVVMYLDGKPYPQALNGLSAGRGNQQIRWDNLVIEDDGGTFPRDAVLEFCVDHPFPGTVPEYDDTSGGKNNCSKVTLRVSREGEIIGKLSLSKNPIAASESVDVTASGQDAQGVLRLGARLCFTPGCAWNTYACPEGSVSCEKTWTYTPNWSGETRTIKGYAQGRKLSGDTEAVYPEAELTVLSGEGGGEVAFSVKEPAPTSAAIARAKVMVHEVAGSALIGECTTDSTGVCAIDIADWSKEYRIEAQAYGFYELSLSPYVFQSFVQILTMSPSPADKVPVIFQIIETGTEADPVFVRDATVKVFALHSGSPVAEFTASSDASGACSFELFRSEDANKSYRATVSHSDYLDGSFEFDIAEGSQGEAYQIPLTKSAGTVEVRFKVINEATRAVVAGATVKIAGIGTRLTGSDGKCIFDLVPGVKYDIDVGAAGYYDYAWDGYLARAGEQVLQIGARQAQGPSATSTTITALSGGQVMNEVSAGVGAGAFVPANALPAGVAGAELTIEPMRTTSGAAAAAMSAVPRGLQVIGSYAYDYSITPNVTLDPPVTISLTYTDDQVAGFDENKLKIYYYDETSSKWVALPTTVNANTNTATAPVSHFTLFVLMFPSCYDSDPSDDKNSRGVVSYETEEYPDACRDDNTVRQYQCDGVNFDQAVNFKDSDCAGLGCTNGVCRSADDRVAVTFQIIEAGTVKPVRAAEVDARNIATATGEGSCKTGEDGKCAIYLSVSGEYQIKVQHSYYENIDYGGLADINPVLNESQPVVIEMIAIPLQSFTTSLGRGWNLIACPTVEPLTWNDLLTSGCRMADPANDDNNEGDDEMAGFLLYGLYGQWVLRKPERPLMYNEVAYVYLDEESCSVHKVGRKDTNYYQSLHVGGEDLGVNFFSVPDFMSFRGIQNDCEEGYIEDNIIYTRNNTTDVFPSVGLDEMLDPFRGYIIKINEYCTLKH